MQRYNYFVLAGFYGRVSRVMYRVTRKGKEWLQLMKKKQGWVNINEIWPEWLPFYKNKYISANKDIPPKKKEKKDVKTNKEYI